MADDSFKEVLEQISDEAVRSKISDAMTSHISSLSEKFEKDASSLRSSLDSQLASAAENNKNLQMEIAGLKDGSFVANSTGGFVELTESQRALQNKWKQDEAEAKRSSELASIQKQLADKDSQLLGYRKKELAQNGVPETILNRAETVERLDDLLAIYEAAKPQPASQNNMPNGSVAGTGTLEGSSTQSVSDDPLARAQNELGSLIESSKKSITI
tara:strand:+ start:1078 stop:1722 length:645 start_codon:yes stop_codon:yes gene_type:complete